MLYDNFEFQAVGEYSDNEGGTFCEPIIGNIEEDEERLQVLWTIYGHLPEGGVEALMDFTDERYARTVFNFLCDLLDSYKKQLKTFDYNCPKCDNFVDDFGTSADCSEAYWKCWNCGCVITTKTIDKIVRIDESECEEN